MNVDSSSWPLSWKELPELARVDRLAAPHEELLFFKEPSPALLLLEGEVEVFIRAPFGGAIPGARGPGSIIGGTRLITDLDRQRWPELQGVAVFARAGSGGARLVQLQVDPARCDPRLLHATIDARDALIHEVTALRVLRLLQALPGLEGLSWTGLLELTREAELRTMDWGAHEASGGRDADPDDPLMIFISGELQERAERPQLHRWTCINGADFFHPSPPLRTWTTPTSATLLVLRRAAITRGLARCPAPPGGRVGQGDRLLSRRLSTLLIEGSPLDAQLRSTSLPQGAQIDLGAPEHQDCLWFIRSGHVRLEDVRGPDRGGERGAGTTFGGASFISERARARHPDVVRSYHSAVATSAVEAVSVRVTERDWTLRQVLGWVSMEAAMLDRSRDCVALGLRAAPTLRDIPIHDLRRLPDFGTLIQVPPSTAFSIPEGEFFVPLRGELWAWPRVAEHRLPSRVPDGAPLGLVEFFSDQRATASLEARVATWLLRVTREDFQSFLDCCSSNRRVIPPGPATGLFDRAGGAEICLLYSRDRAIERALPALGRHLALAIAAEFNDRVLSVALALSPGPIEVSASEADEHRLRLRLPPFASLDRQQILALRAKLSGLFDGWNARYALVLLVPEPGAAEAARCLAPLAEKVVHLTRDVLEAHDLDLPSDCSLVTTVLLPRSRGLPAGTEDPGGVVRLRIPAARLAAIGGGAPLDPADQERLRRWGRAVTDRRVGIALGGGGAFGYAHVALIAELHRRGIPIDLVSGSSFGAVVGAFYAVNGLDGLATLCRLGSVFGVSASASMASTRLLSAFLTLTLPLLGELGEPDDLNRLLSGDVQHLPLGLSPKKALRLLGLQRSAYKGELTYLLEDQETLFFPVATDVETGEEHVFRRGSIQSAVRASGSFPIFMSTAELLGRRFVDGGIANIVPHQVLLRERAAMVIASNPLPPPTPRRPEAPEGFTAGLADRVSRAPGARRFRDGVRSTFILMHALGANERSGVDATFNSPPVEHQFFQFGGAGPIIRSIRNLPELDNTLGDARRHWDRITAGRDALPRRPGSAGSMLLAQQSPAEVGWGLMTVRGADEAILRALHPLIEHRRDDARGRVRLFTGEDGYQGESPEALLRRLSIVPGMRRPPHLPHYLLLVGSPEEIPFEIQFALDRLFAVGRICFDEVVDYAHYAQSVATAERVPGLRARHLTLTGPAEPELLREALHSRLLNPVGRSFLAEHPDWRVEQPAAAPGGAGDRQLTAALGGAETPALFLYAGPAAGDADHQGPGHRGDLTLRPGRRFCEADLLPEASLSGSIVFLLGDHTAGTPAEPEFDFTTLPEFAAGHRAPIPLPLLSPLSQRLLSLPAGGALAVVGKVDVAWTVLVDGARPWLPQVWSEMLQKLAGGHRLGTAVDALTRQRLHLSSELQDAEQAVHRARTAGLEAVELEALIAEAERLRVASVDLRNYIVLGDPAVRLNLTDPTGQPYTYS